MAVVALNSANFEAEVMQSEVPVLIDFWASWCGPCKMLSPVVDSVAEKAEGFKVGKVNVDEEPELARQFQVFSIPTLVVISGGQEVKRSVGVISEDEIVGLVK